MVRRFVHTAKVIFVHEGNVFEAVFDMGFSVTVRARVSVKGFDVPSFRAPDKASRSIARSAKDCAMRILLNRWCLVETFKENTSPSVWPANIFVPCQTKFRDAVIEIEGEEYVDLCKYLRVLSDHNFDLGMIDIAAQA